MKLSVFQDLPKGRTRYVPELMIRPFLIKMRNHKVIEGNEISQIIRITSTMQLISFFPISNSSAIVVVVFIICLNN